MTISDPMVLVAQITAPHGLGGQFRVKSYMQNPTDLWAFETLLNHKGEPVDVQFVRQKSDSVFIATTPSVKSCEQAETLRNIDLYVPRSSLPALEKDEFFYSDLEGYAVYTQDNNLIGHILSVHNFGAGDFLEIKKDDNTLYTLPFTKEAVLEVHAESQKILIDDNFLLN